MEFLRDRVRELRIVNVRLKVFLVFAVLLAMGLVSRFLYLQVMRYQDMATQSDDNRINLRITPANRGLIYDTNGEFIAVNRPSRIVSIVQERAAQIGLDALIIQLSSLIDLQDWEIKSFYRQIESSKPFASVPVRFDLKDEELAQIAVNLFRLPGVELDAELIRFYPEGSLYAHSVGYVGRITVEELQRKTDGYKGDYAIGKIGIEKYYEEELRGKAGYREVETNASGRVIRTVRELESEPGKDLHLYLHTPLQKEAVKAMANSRGAVVAIDPETGGILSMVSSPSFDPNQFITGIETTMFHSLHNNSNKPLYNIATLGEYPPASTIKPVIGLGLLDEGFVSTSDKIFDVGWFQIPGSEHRFRNWKREGHKWVDLERAIIVSNDSFFYNQAAKVGIDWVHDFVSKFGLGKPLNLDIGEERVGLIPSKSWKEKTHGVSWYSGETVIAVIGQGYMSVTPMQLAAMTTMIANRGKYVPLKFAKGQKGSKGHDIVLNKQENWEFIINAMEQVIISPQGTAHYRIGRGLQYRMAGKTGTAQVVSIAQGEEYDEEKLHEYEKDHSLFVAFAPIKKPKIVVSVIMENSSGASYIARKLLDFYLLSGAKKNL